MRLVTLAILTLIAGLISSSTCKNASGQKVSIAATDTVFFHHRSYCYGRCKVYKLLITGDGTAHYEAIANNETMGLFECRNQGDKWKEFISDATSMGYFNLNERYDNTGISDLPMKTTAMRGEHGLKWLYDRYRGPAMMDKLYERMDTIIAQTQWIPKQN
jgi:hypothetical protein